MSRVQEGASSFSAALLLVAFLWGAGFTSSKVAVADVPPFTTGLMRYALALIVLLPLYLRERQRIRPAPISRKTWIALAGLGITAVTAYNGFYFGGLRLAPSSDSILLIPTTSPIWTAVFAALFIGESPGRRLKIGLVVVLAGMVMVLVGGNAADLDRDRLLGNGMFVLGALVFGISHVISRVATRGISPIGATTLAGIIGGLALVPFALFEGGFGPLLDAPLRYWLNMVFVAIGITAIGYVLFYRSVTKIGPGPTAFYTNLVPIFGLTLSAILLGEIPTPLQFTGGALMLGTVIWVTTERRITPVPASSKTGTQQ